jgi:transcriptional repressor NrdR
MVCVYCSSDTQVTNSRHQRRANSVWRRRACKNCGAVFTTHESPNLEAAARVIGKNGHLYPFMRDKLFISLYESCRHRPTALEDATALTDTVVSQILKQQGSMGVIDRDTIKSAAQQVLNRFDSVASTYYGAYFGKLNS